MRTAPPGFSFMVCAICPKFVDCFAIIRAYLFCRLPILPLVCFSAPIPPTPFPAGRGDYKLILPGASPPAPRHQTVYGTDSPCRCSTRRGACPLCHLPPLPLACFLAPIPPPALAERSSRREGGDYKLILPGALPPAPRHQTVYGTDIPCRCSTPEGGAPSLSPANPAFSLLFCPLYRRGRMDSPAPIPPTPFPMGRGDFSFLMQGASPLASRGLDGVRHWLGEHWRYPAGGLPSWPSARPATATPGGVGQTKRGP